MAVRMFDVQYPHEPLDRDAPFVLICPLCGHRDEGTVGEMITVTGIRGESDMGGTRVTFDFRATIPHQCEGGVITGRAE